MKLLLLLGFVTIVLCEPPLPTYGAPQPSAKQEATAPYPPSGWRPQGRQFHIVAKVPQTEYGVPETTTTENDYSTTTEVPTTTSDYLSARFAANVNNNVQEVNQPYPPNGAQSNGPEFHLVAKIGRPENEYGPPPANRTKTENVTTEQLESPSSDVEPIDRGVYYIYHPSGLLQRVAYFTGNDVKDMALVAQLRYKDVEPIKEPIYTYDPNTYVLKKIEV